MTRSDRPQGAQDVRLDKWLWAARFFKTRSLAHRAVVAGRVFVDGIAAKASRTVHVGQELSIVTPRGRFDVVVRGISASRGSASIAAELFDERAESIERRQEASRLRRLADEVAPPERPNTQQRRLIRNLKES